MKLVKIIIATAMGLSSMAFAADEHKHGHEHESLHGGVVVEVKDVDYELVAKPEMLQLYLRDHGKPMDVSKASAKVTLLAGTDKQEVQLAPAGDKLQAKGNFKAAAGTKALAAVTVNGKTSTVRFVLK